MKQHLPKIIIGLLILLAFLNPTQSDFEKYILFRSQAPYDLHSSRDSYFLFFSIYKAEYTKPGYVGYSDYQESYIGIFKNFVQTKSTMTFRK